MSRALPVRAARSRERLWITDAYLIAPAPMYAAWLSSQPDPTAARATIEAHIPLGRRMTTSEEIANTVAFLLSERSSHTTGQLIHVDGGYVHLDRAF